jgi:hypothetical protein
VSQYIVQLTGDTEPLLIGAAALGLGPLPPLAGELLPPNPGEFGGGQHCEQPGRRPRGLRPRGRTVTGRRQPAVQPNADQ